MAAYFGFVGHIVALVARKGVPKQQGREYMALMFAGLSDAGQEASQQSFEDFGGGACDPRWTE